MLQLSNEIFFIFSLSLPLIVMHEQSLRYLQTQTETKKKSNSVNGEQVLLLETCPCLSIQLLIQYSDIYNSIPATSFIRVGVD